MATSSVDKLTIDTKNISWCLDIRYYFVLANFRFREPLTEITATGITYGLFCFFVWILSTVWLKFNGQNSLFNFNGVFFYIGITEMLFMSFLSSRSIQNSTEDFSLFLARPRSWLGRELASNIGINLGKRLMFLASLCVFAICVGVHPVDWPSFLIRAIFLICVLALPQALVSAFFSTLRLSYPQTDYFVLPFGKLFLSLGGVFGPLSDYGEPWRSIFLKLPGSDLFFQPAFFAVHGRFYEMSLGQWLVRILLINLALWLIVRFLYQKGRRDYQAWGG
jgi:hypothetical protein